MDSNQIKKIINDSIPYLISGSILINLFITLGNPEIFLGKKTFFSQSIIPLSSIIFMLISVYLLLNHKLTTFKLKEPLQICLAIFIITSVITTLLFQSQNLLWIGSSIFLFFILTITASTQISKALNHCLVPITVIALLQFIFQTDLNLQLLNEPNLSLDIKGISKIWSPFHTNPQIRSYGLFPHPNILGSFTTLIIILNNQAKLSKAHFLNFFTSFSLSNNITNLVFQITQRTKHLVILAVIILLTTFTYRFPFNNTTNIQERIEQHQETFIPSETQNKPWEIQPTHNTYLYSYQNLSIIHLLAFIVLNIALFKKDKAIALCLNILFLSDHYFLTNPNSFYLLIIFIFIISETETIQTPKNSQTKNLEPA